MTPVVDNHASVLRPICGDNSPLAIAPYEDFIHNETTESELPEVRHPESSDVPGEGNVKLMPYSAPSHLGPSVPMTPSTSASLEEGLSPPSLSMDDSFEQNSDAPSLGTAGLWRWLICAGKDWARCVRCRRRCRVSQREEEEPPYSEDAVPSDSIVLDVHSSSPIGKSGLERLRDKAGLDGCCEDEHPESEDTTCGSSLGATSGMDGSPSSGLLGDPVWCAAQQPWIRVGKLPRWELGPDDPAVPQPLADYLDPSDIWSTPSSTPSEWSNIYEDPAEEVPYHYALTEFKGMDELRGCASQMSTGSSEPEVLGCCDHDHECRRNMPIAPRALMARGIVGARPSLDEDLAEEPPGWWSPRSSSTGTWMERHTDDRGHWIETAFTADFTRPSGDSDEALDLHPLTQGAKKPAPPVGVLACLSLPLPPQLLPELPDGNLEGIHGKPESSLFHLPRERVVSL